MNGNIDEPSINEDHLISSRIKKPFEHENDFQFVLDCKYYDNSSFNSLPFSINAFSFFHLNISSLNLLFDSFNFFLESLKLKLNVIAISETRIASSAHNE